MQQEIVLVEYLKTQRKKGLMSMVEDRFDECTGYYDIISNMCNSYSFPKEQALQDILADTKIADVFLLFALRWIEGMALVYTPSYLDERDKVAVSMCHKIAELRSFSELSERMFPDKYKNDYPGIRRDTLQIDAYTGVAIFEMHHTLRQTYTGFVLTFLARNAKCKKIMQQAVCAGVWSSDQQTISFFMI